MIYIFLFLLGIAFLFLYSIYRKRIKKLKDRIEKIEEARKKENVLFRKKIDYIKTYIDNIEGKIRELENLKEGDIFTLGTWIERIDRLLKNDSLAFEKNNKAPESIKENIKRLSNSFLEIKELLIGFKEPVKKNFDNIYFTQERLTDIKQVSVSVKKLVNQIRLIAFNADIESSRGSNENRSFGVIASQIRNLVDEIEETTTEIEEIIKDLEDVFSEEILISEILLKKQDKITDINEMVFNLIEALSRSTQKLSDFSQEMEGSYENYKEIIDKFRDVIQKTKETEVKLEDEKRRYKENLRELLILIEDVKKSIESDIDE